ncbi:MAG TPA: hypothetical protein DDW52_00590 [Planctomycetaceae bacterium]|nr:hypothetical protein [Planctomycetaceae bacterium]
MQDAVEAHFQNVFRFALRLAGGDIHIAEDITQDTMTKALARSAQLSDPAALRSWLFSIATNCWIDHLRGRKRQCSEVGLAQAAAPEQSDAIELTEEYQLALKALDRLPDRQRSVMYLTACEAMSIKEVAEVLDISPDAVKASLYVARVRLRRILNPQID